MASGWPDATRRQRVVRFRYMTAASGVHTLRRISAHTTVRRRDAASASRRRLTSLARISHIVIGASGLRISQSCCARTTFE
jgi:hypothetical protein